MAVITASKSSVTIKPYVADNTVLAFNFASQSSAKEHGRLYRRSRTARAGLVLPL
jgi:hypothetical protein